jgi:CBS domain-containing protein
MRARELMTPDPFTVTATDSVFRAAELMRNVGVGSLPVVLGHEDGTLVGIITDRDIVTRCVSQRHYALCEVGTHMTSPMLETVHPDDDVKEVIHRMEHGRVRRIPVVDDKGILVGIITQADLATKLGPINPAAIEEVLERISEPTHH